MSLFLHTERPILQASETDEALMKSFYGGSQDAFSVVYSRYQERSVVYAWRILRRREEAEEISAEIWLKVARGAWKPTGSFRSFLFTVLHRRCLDRIRQRQRRIRLLPWVQPPLFDGHTPEDAAVKDQRLFQLEAALAGLSDEQRTAVLLYYGEELSSREVAAIVGCTDQQLRSRLSYARRKLRGVMLPAETA